MSISAQSAASTPPASERIVTSASRASYSPDSRVRTSSSSIARVSSVSSVSVSARAAASDSSSAISRMIARSSMRLRSPSTRATSFCAWRQPRGDPLRALLVVPQVGGGGLLVEVGDLGAQLVEVEHGLDGAERRVELLEGFAEFLEGHAPRVRDRPRPLPLTSVPFRVVRGFGGHGLRNL